MKVEYEVKVLDIDVNYIENKLIALWAEVFDEMLMKRWVYDFSNKNKNDWNVSAEWYRLRDDWNKITIIYKVRTSNTIWWTKEVELVVDDFDVAHELLSKLDWDNTYYQENRRKLFLLDWIEFTIDSWPMIPSYLEIESSSKQDVERWLNLLWLENNEYWDFSVLSVYEKYGIDLHKFKKLTFEK